MKHTPGPWNQTSEIDKKGKLTGKHFIYDSNDGLGSVYRGVATVYGKDKKENKANRDLIAAAPEMLAALETMLKLVELEYEGTHFPDVAAKIDDARKAINKARGGV